jgi:nickel-dependent lactate racemase
MKSNSVPAWEWNDWKPETITFPESWDVHVQKMKGHNTKSLKPREIEEKVQHPIGTKQLSEIAKGRKKCVIIFDDMTRPTKTTQLLPPIIGELHKAGIKDDQIVFIMASGAHTGRMLFDFQKKLGEEICESTTS